MARNLNARNFGLYSRDMTKAALNAMREREASYNTQHTTADRFAQFAKQLQERSGVKDLRWITRTHIEAYADSLVCKVSDGELKLNTAVNYLSAVNIVLEQARGDRMLWVRPSDHFDPRSQVSSKSRAPSSEMVSRTHDFLTTQAELGRRIDAVIQLAQAFGHRFEEAALFNARAALKQLQKGASKITIRLGTKGGRVRYVPITTEKQVNVLRYVAGMQGKGRSIIPSRSNYIQFRNAAYHALYHTPLKGFHGLRHEYAQTRYEMLTKVKCPVASNMRHGRAHHAYVAKQLGLSLSAARQLDHAARTTIAQELGHGRLEITNNYLG